MDEQEDQKQQARVVSRHLPPGYSAGADAFSRDAPASSQKRATPDQESSLNLQGGDIHRELYKIDARARQPKRAATFSYPSKQTQDGLFGNESLSAAEQRAPGGFRRQYIQEQQGSIGMITTPITKSFVDFLDLYGNFAGEDLNASDDESDQQSIDDREQGRSSQSDERRPLLRGRRTGSKYAPKPGDASQIKSFFTLLKAFIGTGILFLPKAFNNGGILFSSLTLLTVSILSALCFRLLLQCKAKYSGGYGEIGEAIAGRKLRHLILASITISQIGFVCASLIFVAENLAAVITALSPGKPISSNALIGLQLAWLIPFALIRQISKLGPAALVADLFIGIGLAYIYYYTTSSLAAHGLHESVKLFNPSQFTLTIGSAIFTFEGIGLILPIQNSMKQPEKFGRLLYMVMVIITIIFASVGAMSYATFGSETKTEVLSNFPQTSKLVNAIQAIYSAAVLVGTPVQLFPATRILEGKVFGRYSGKRDALTKWKKNAFRTAIVIACGVISILGASDLDKFVALIGSFACVPLVYIYPAYLHYKGVAESRWACAADILIMLVGFAGMIFTTAITVIRWVAE